MDAGSHGQSETPNPTLTRIDHLLCTREWEVQHTNNYLQAISSSMSDHCPLLLTCTPLQHRYKGFRFESYWVQLEGFQEVVQQSWNKPCRSTDPARTLHIKLAQLGKALKT
jgi:hypothetical protein